MGSKGEKKPLLSVYNQQSQRAFFRVKLQILTIDSIKDFNDFRF